jgi:hypothetical protein
MGECALNRGQVCQVSCIKRRLGAVVITTRRHVVQRFATLEAKGADGTPNSRGRRAAQGRGPAALRLVGLGWLLNAISLGSAV